MPNQQQEPFPIGSAVDTAYRSLLRHPLYAFHICWAWVIVMTSARVVSDIIKSNYLMNEAGEPLLGFDLTFFIGWFLFVPLASIAVAWHRLLLFEERDRSAIYLRLDYRVLSYFAFAVLLYAISLAPVFLVRGVGQIMTMSTDLEAASLANEASRPGFMLGPNIKSIISGLQVIAVLVFLALSARLSVMLPGKAFGSGGTTIRGTWEATRGHTWGLLMGFLSCIVPFLLLSALMRRAGFNFTLEDGALLHIADWLALETMGAILGLIEIAYLTFCFRFFFPEEVPEPGEQAVERSSASS